MSYESVKLDTPDIFKDTAIGESVLIIGSGDSTKDILHLKEWVRDAFDKIIVCNYSFEFFDDISDFHLVIEKTSKTSTNDVYKKLSDKDYRTDVPRIVNWKGINMYPKKYSLIKTTRSAFNGKPDIRKYSKDGMEGLLNGNVGSQGFSLGSILLGAMHFSGIIGAKDIYIIGGDLCFRGEYDHFYNDSVYRSPPKKVKPKNAHKIISVDLNGKKFDTTMYFKESADFINGAIETHFKDLNVYDFSNGLLTNAEQLDINKFLGIKNENCV